MVWWYICFSLLKIFQMHKKSYWKKSPCWGELIRRWSLWAEFFRVKHSGPLFPESKSLRESKCGSCNISPDKKITRLYILLREELLLLPEWQMCALEFKLLWTISQAVHVLLNWQLWSCDIYLWDIYQGHSHALVIKGGSTSTCHHVPHTVYFRHSFCQFYSQLWGDHKQPKAYLIVNWCEEPFLPHMTQIWRVLIWNICIWSFELLGHCFSVAELLKETQSLGFPKDRISNWS